MNLNEIRKNPQLSDAAGSRYGFERERNAEKEKKELMMVEAGGAECFSSSHKNMMDHTCTLTYTELIISSRLWVCPLVSASADRRRLFSVLLMWSVSTDPPQTQNPAVAIRSHLWSTVCIWSGDFLHVGKQCERRKRWLFPLSKLLSKLPCVQISPEYQCSCGGVHWIDGVRKRLQVFPLLCSLSRNNYHIFLSDSMPKYLQRAVKLISWPE